MNKFKSLVLALTIFSFCASQVKATPWYDDPDTLQELGEVSAGITFVSIIAIYGYSFMIFRSVDNILKDEDVAKGELFSSCNGDLFATYNPKDRLVCKWNEKAFPTRFSLESYAKLNKELFENSLVKAFSGAYSLENANSQYFLCDTVNSIVQEIDYLNSLRKSLVLIGKFPFVSKGALNRIEKLKIYEERLSFIHEAIVGLPMYRKQIEDYDRRKYIESGTPPKISGKVDY